jgi:cytochrome c oxidase cbb3-type subunit 2
VRYLLDTCAFLWVSQQTVMLSKAAVAAIRKRAALAGIGFSWMSMLAFPLAAEDAPKARGGASYELYMQGRHVYEQNCLICHGDRGDGNGEMAKDLPVKPRSFREGFFKFRSTPYDKLPTDNDLRRTITGGLSGTTMGMYKHLGEKDLEATIEYLKSFSRRWRKADNYAAAIEFPAPPAWLADAGARTEHAEKGRVIFSAMCAGCHGPAGDGNGPAAQALKDAWGQSVTPADLRQPHLRCGDGPSDIFRILTTGMSGTPMVSFAGALGVPQRWDVVAYVLSLRPSNLQQPTARNP